MDQIRKTLIQYLNDYIGDEGELFRKIEDLAKKKGDEVFRVLLNVLAHLEFSNNDARKKWHKIIQHRKKMETAIGRHVSLTTATCDYFSSVKKNIHVPKIIDVNIFEKTAKLSSCDTLTGLKNRGYFEEAMTREFKRADRYNSLFSMVFFDLDDFKKLNDSMGHQAGDNALKRVSDEIKRQKRTEDTAARYGGEEITLILPQTSKPKAIIIAERIRQAVEKMVFTCNGQTFKVTISGGVATFPVDSASPEGVINCADKALYRAKNNGKNNIAPFSPERRRFNRIEFTEKIQAADLKEEELFITVPGKNLSFSGVLFISPDLFETGSIVLLRIPSFTKWTSKPIKGRIERTEPVNSSFDVGVSFQEILNPALNGLFTLDRLKE